VLGLSLVGVGLAAVVASVLVLAAATGSAAAAVALGRTAGLPAGRTSFLAGWGALGLGLAVALLASPVLAALVATGIVVFGLGSLVPQREQVEPAAPEADDGVDEALLQAVEEALGDEEPRILAAFPIGSGAEPN
jgi:hypothetical protein